MLRSYLGNLLLLSASNSMRFYLMIMHVHHCSFIPTCAAVYTAFLSVTDKSEIWTPHTMITASLPTRQLSISWHCAVISCINPYKLSPSFFIFHQDARESYRTRLPSSHHFAYSNMGLGMRLGALHIYLHSYITLRGRKDFLLPAWN